MRPRRLLFLSLLLLLSPGACRDTTTPPERVVPTAVRLDRAGLTIDDGTGERLTATVYDQRGRVMDPLPAGVSILWTSSDSAVASVDSSGLVTGKRPGTALIRAIVGSLSAEATVTVRQVPAALSITDGRDQAAPAGAPLPAPVAARVVDRHGDGVPGVAVTFAVTSGGGSVTPATGSTDDGGLVEATWTLGPEAGPQTLTASAASLSGSPAEVHATATAAAPASIEKRSGDGQQAPVGATLPEPVVVRVTDAFGNPVPGVTVSWVVTAGAGSADPLTGITDADGTASTRWTLGPGGGEQALTAVAAGMSAVFGVTAAAGPVAALTVVGGGGQTGAAGEPLADSLRVRATDAFGNPVGGIAVSWRVTQGGGGISPASARTDAAGHASAAWTLGTTAGAQGAAASAGGVDADFTSQALPGAPAALTPVAGDAQAGTAAEPLPDPLMVRVEDAHGNPVPGAAVSWSVVEGGGSLAPASSRTDAGGRAEAVWTLGGAGAQRAEARHGTLAPAAFTATAAPRPSGLVLVPVTGTAIVDSVLSSHRVAVEVRDEHGDPQPGVTVRWAVVDGGGAVSPAASTTGVGIASTTWTLGGTPGTQTLSASLDDGTAVRFSATATPGVPFQMARISGDRRSATVGSEVPLVARLEDRRGNPVPDAAVHWEMRSGGGSVAGTEVTDTDGTTSALAFLGPLVGEQRFRVESAVGPATTFVLRGLAGRVAAVTVTPSSLDFDTYGERARLRAEPRDSAGAVLPDQEVRWFSRDTTVARVEGEGWVAAAGQGETWVIGQAEGAQDSAFVRVDLRSSLVALEVTPAESRIEVVGGRVQLHAIGRDTSGAAVGVQGVLWRRLDGPATVDGQGLVTATGEGTARIEAAWGESLADTATVVIDYRAARVEISKDSLLVGPGLQDTVSARVYDANGTLFSLDADWSSTSPAVFSVTSTAFRATVRGEGVGTARLVASVDGVVDTVLVLSREPLTFRPGSVSGVDEWCALTDDGEAWCWDRGPPAPLRGGLRWAELSVGQGAACGITAGGVVHCWGTYTGASPDPAPLPGDPGLTRVSAGRSYACGVTADGTAYCWGRNAEGQLGTGGSSGPTPAPVAGGLRFSRIEAGRFTTCGIALSGRMYCWGREVGSPVPVEVLTGDAYVEAATGNEYCGLTTDGRVRCSSPPAPLSGVDMREISSSRNYVCGLDTSGAAWCFGGSSFDPHPRGNPATDYQNGVPVLTSLRFTGLATGELATCALALDGRAYCWGMQLPDPMVSASYEPRAVFPPWR